MASRNKNGLSLSSPVRFKNRRTSLNVNLSYVSSASLLTDEVDELNTSSSISEKSVNNNSPEKTVINRSSLSMRRNLSLRKFSSGNKQLKLNATSTTTNDVNNAIKIKPSFVKMVRIRTSTPLISRFEKLTENRISEETYEPSENLKRTSILEDVRFPLDGEIFSPNASVVMETSMDMTEVQGRVVLNSDPVVARTLNISSDVERGDESSVVIEDTEDVGREVEERIEMGIIPDSEQDSVNTIRTSLHVNTSIDSRFSSVPNNSLYDPRKSEDRLLEQDAITGNELDGILSYPISESLDENLPVNSVVVTTAVIEHRSSTDDRNHQDIQDQETTIRLEPLRESQYLHDAPVQSENNKSDDKTSSANDNESTRILSLINQDDESLHPRISNEENDTFRPVMPSSIAAKNPIKKGKKRLLRLRRSEMVELSPVSVEMVRGKRTVPKKRDRRRNKTAKKVDKKKDDNAKRFAQIYTSDEDLVEVDLQPRKEKKVRKVKTKKIVIKKMADVGLWKRLNENFNTTNESCDEISSALGRTSLNDFEPKNNIVRHKNRKMRPKIIIVASGLPMEQKLLVKSTVTTLGSAKLEKIVTRNTTHVVSQGTRTVNLLRGLIRGCWLVNFDWISKSCQAGEWLDPEEYEITSFSKAVQENRKEKQLFGSAYVSELFLTCGLIHIKEETSTPAPVLKELVRIAGGRVATEPEEAKIIIGRGGFKEIWILDSITNGEIQPLDQYCKKKCLNQD